MTTEEQVEFLSKVRARQSCKGFNAYYGGLDWDEYVRQLLELVDQYQSLENKLTNDDDELFAENQRLQQQVRAQEADVAKLLGFVRHSISFANQPFNSSELSKTEAREMLDRLEPKVHYCTEWDYLLIRPGDVEFEACVCYD